MMKAIRVTVFVAGFAALAVFGLARLWPQVPVDAAPTAPGAVPARLVCSGYVDCRWGQVMLQPVRAGRVTQVLAKERQAVSKDAPLVQLDDHLVRLQEQEAALAVEAAQVQLAKARDGVKQYQARRTQAEAAEHAAHAKYIAAQHLLTIEEQLHEQGYSSKDRLGATRAQLDAANALVEVERYRVTEINAVDPELEVKLAQLQLSRSQARLERARQEREEYLLRAPVNGLVLRVQAQEGDLLGPTSPRPAVWLAPEGAWIVRAEVSQEFAGRVRENLDVQVEDEAGGGVLARGKVAEVSDWFLPRRQHSLLPTAVNTGQTLECVVELREGQAQLRLGQHVRVRILADQPAPESSTQLGGTRR
jgi:multidrug resistance efflux pump